MNLSASSIAFRFLLLSISLAIFPTVHAQAFFENNAISKGLINNTASGINLGGVSFYDYDKDGWDDITTACKGSEPVRFFKNNAGILTEEFFNIAITGHSKQVLWVDYDNDGDNDLFVTRVDASNSLYQNDGNFNFTNVTVAAGFPAFAVLYTYGAAFGDIDNDGYLDLFLSNKDDSNVIPNQLYHNNGDGTFSDITNTSGISSVGHLTFCAAFFDYDKDGFQDIYLSNDRFDNPNILYRNNGNSTFTDVSVASGTNVAANAMSTTISDFDADGWLDIYVTNTAEGNHLFKNNGDGTFTDIAVPSGTSFNSIGWGANFFDADNDTDLDLYVSSMIDNPAVPLLTTAFYECQIDQTYQLSSSSSGFANDEFISFSNAIGDLDNNGYQDFVVANQAPDNHSLWQNTGGSNNWLKVKLEGVSSNRQGIGSWIEIHANGQTMYRYTLCGEAFLAQNSGTEIFGIGNATTIDYVKVRWLSGVEDMLTNVSPNQTMTIVEGSTLSLIDHQDNSTVLYPNPTQGLVYIKSIKQPLELSVFDTLGRLILKRNILSVNDSIDLTGFKKGLYVFVIESERFKTIEKIIHY